MYTFFTNQPNQQRQLLASDLNPQSPTGRKPLCHVTAFSPVHVHVHVQSLLSFVVIFVDHPTLSPSTLLAKQFFFLVVYTLYLSFFFSFFKIDILIVWWKVLQKANLNFGQCTHTLLFGHFSTKEQLPTILSILTFCHRRRIGSQAAAEI